MPTNAPRITPRSLIAPADLGPFRAAVVELPPDESRGPGRLPAFADLRQHLRRLVSATEVVTNVTSTSPERA